MAHEVVGHGAEHGPLEPTATAGPGHDDRGSAFGSKVAQRPARLTFDGHPLHGGVETESGDGVAEDRLGRVATSIHDLVVFLLVDHTAGESGGTVDE